MFRRVVLLVATFLSCLSVSSIAQNLLSNPESIVYDAERGVYLISNWNDGGPGSGERSFAWT